MGFMSDTSKFTNTQVLYDDGSFVIAKGIWDNQSPTIGARWHDEGIGYPQTYGKPQWFIFPDDIGTVIQAFVAMAKMTKNIRK